MAVIESFRTAFSNYYSLWASKLGINQKQAAIKEETLRKLHGLSDQFIFAGLDEDYTEALIHYHTMLTLLNVDLSDVAWNLTTGDLVTLFGSGGSVSSQYTTYTDGVSIFRSGVRSLYFVIDQALTVTGFDGIENTDWTNLYNTKSE